MFAIGTALRDRAVIFGDAGGAFVLEADDAGDGRGFLGFEMRTDGTHWDKLYVPAGGSASFPYFSPEMFESMATIPIVEGRQVFKLATTAMPAIVREVLQKHGLDIADLSLLLMHQANLRINESVQKTLGLPDEKVFNNIQKYGNTTAATLPLVFHEAKQAGRVKSGDLVCFTALGAGLHWGAGLVRI
jgi:3-oxoacyl-[acyl-carrier-protein] synthase-3